MEPTRPRIGPLVTIGAMVAVAMTASLVLLVIHDAADRTASDTSTATPGPPRTAAPSVSLTGTAEDGAPYALWARDHRGAPLRWDACSPIRFRINLRDAPSGAQQDIERALDILADASGLDLLLEGLTEEAPDPERPLVEPDGSGWRWRPVLIAWAHPDTHGSGLTAADRAVALPVAVRDGDRESYVTGQVVLNAARPDLVPGFADRSTAVGATLLHELGHVLGLDHVDDPGQLMSVDPGSGPVTLGSGDLAGLQRIGSAAGCTPAPPPSAGRGLTVTR